MRLDVRIMRRLNPRLEVLSGNDRTCAGLSVPPFHQLVLDRSRLSVPLHGTKPISAFSIRGYAPGSRLQRVVERQSAKVLLLISSGLEREDKEV